MQFWRQRARDSLGAMSSALDIGGGGGTAAAVNVQGVVDMDILQQEQEQGQQWRGGEEGIVGIDWSSTTLLEDMGGFPQQPVNPSQCIYPGSIF